MVTGERQAGRIRGLYLKTILRQDIGFFDKETNTGEVVGRMSGDTVLIQDAMGEKVCTIHDPSIYPQTTNIDKQIIIINIYVSTLHYTLSYP